MALLVERMGECAEALLTCCVPDFDRGRLAAFCWTIRLGDVVETESGHMRLLELLLIIHFKERCFSNRSIAQDYETNLLLRHLVFLVNYL